MQTIRRLGKKILFSLFYVGMSLYLPVVYFFSYHFGELKYLSREDYRIWTRAMLDVLREYCRASYNYRIRQVMFAFGLSKLSIVRRTENVPKDYPIVVLSIKNDQKRVQMLIEHYRKLGVKRFAFLDNNSDDGTFEWLLEQPDIDLYRTTERYQTAVKEGWINRLVSYYGFNRWYIVTDSDELMVYTGMEQHDLKDLIAYAERHHIRRFKGLTLDMYTKSGLFAKSDDIRETVRWFDTDTYHASDNVAGTAKMVQHFGGPRYRIMGSKINLTKYPLVYFEPGTVSVSAHFQFPFQDLDSRQCDVGILHFKFLENDLEVYRQRAKKSGGFSTGGAIYKKYINAIQEGECNTFFYEDSCEFCGSESLDSVEMIKKLDFSDGK